MRTLFALLVTALPAQAELFKGDIWADNWFRMTINGRTVAIDSVPLTTERSFNAESFQFSAKRPFVIGIIAKDFKENDSGLEYIGTRKQQLGDGGLIAQFKSENDTMVTNADWRCMVVHDAPLDKSCARERNPVAGKGACAFKETPQPALWNWQNFDDSKWSKASEWSKRDVRPKDGYDRIRWDKDAKFIWGPDLETNNTVICRIEVR